MSHFLDALQNIQAAAAAITLEGIGGIGDQLQLAENKLRNDQHAVQKACLGDVRDPPVDNHAGIEHLERLFWRFLAPKNAAQRSQVEHISLLSANHQTDVRHPEKQSDLNKRRNIGLTEHQTHQESSENTQYRSESSPYKPLQAHSLQPNLKQNNKNSENQPTQCGEPWIELKRRQKESTCREYEYKDNANNHQIQQATTPFGPRTSEHTLYLPKI